MDEGYRWDDISYQRIAAAGVAWQDVMHVLRHAHPVYRRHIGALLHIAGLSASGEPLAVTLIEEGDDDYLIVGARMLHGAERDAVEKLLEGGGQA